MRRAYNSVMTPIYQTSTFRFADIGVTRGFDYTRMFGEFDGPLFPKGLWNARNSSNSCARWKTAFRFAS